MVDQVTQGKQGIFSFTPTYSSDMVNATTKAPSPPALERTCRRKQ